jgi:hypothetical protein
MKPKIKIIPTTWLSFAIVEHNGVKTTVPGTSISAAISNAQAFLTKAKLNIGVSHVRY